MINTKIFAHRGASAYAPENTMEAFKLAIKQNADGIEIDVHLTKDNHVVVIHDETIDRVSNGKGFVRDYTLEELRQFSYNYNFNQYENVKIPTLEDVLELIKPTNLILNIELKTNFLWYENIEEIVLSIVDKFEMQDRIIYSSFNHYS
ncbi:MAG: glycerophosphodiester phosphodiesterase, partial [Eubacteriales bacterium]|nr:glycerophosphodiester phosphodiesterase [Eubacteriales bacterium]